ncbi:unnamed protein product [Schistosoma margrebowiei]|uniref:Uncharacterized protein n=1 Tax=Schistosoma margrebowiei TaxID=48269 RepID=A0AA85A879_9TREM|nr:unnamed protein product [Schistosoma margrebowiei]
MLGDKPTLPNSRFKLLIQPSFLPPTQSPQQQNHQPTLSIEPLLSQIRETQPPISSPILTLPLQTTIQTPQTITPISLLLPPLTTPSSTSSMQLLLLFQQ